MACVPNAAKVKGLPLLGLAAVFCIFLGMTARAYNTDPASLLNYTQEALNLAEAVDPTTPATDRAAKQRRHLAFALTYLKQIPKEASYADHCAAAIALVQSASDALSQNDPDHTADDLVRKALVEVRAAMALQSKEPKSTPGPGAGANPGGDNPFGNSSGTNAPPPVPPATPPPAPVVNGPVAGQPWENDLGMQFVPAGTDGVLFSIWDTRVKDFQAFVDATGYDATAGMYSIGSDGEKPRGDSWKSPGFTQTENDPVVGMSGADGDAFCQWLTKKEQAEGKLGPNQEYRLPTNAEWNMAVGSAQYPWGDDWPPPDGAGNYAGKEAQDEKWDQSYSILPDHDDGYPRTSPVGSFKPNAYGLYDMGGNVHNWCEDNLGVTMRGSAWDSSVGKYLVSSWKWRNTSISREDTLGFRIVLVVTPQKNAPPKKSGPSTSNPSLSNPFGSSSAATNSPQPVQQIASTVALTTDQARAVVLIKGDNGEGTGFLVKTADGPAVVTNLHVIADNPNLKIMTNSGAQIAVLSLKGASDRDLAMFAIKDQNYNYLSVPADISLIVQPGDEVITPGNSEGGEVMLNTKGKLLGIGPDRVEFDNPIYHGNSGGPVLLTKSGQVIGVVTEAIKVVHSDDLDKTSFASRNSAITGSMRYFGLRIDTVPKWEPYDLQRFENETTFLDQFNHRSRCLDSYLNTPDDDKPDSILYREDADIVKANTSYVNQVNGGGDTSEKLEALRELLGDLNGLADADMDAIHDVNSFYTFDQQQAKEELAYRKALKKELDEFGNNISRASSLPRSN